MRIVTAMSGGVDSSAAAFLLLEQGHEVIGLFMQNGVHSEREGGKGCCTIEDAHDAANVAAQLGIPFYAVNFEQEFGQLIDYFIREYDAGRTPNPCVMCNRVLKFGHLLKFARELNADAVATGHYARAEARGPRYLLRKATDAHKDQSYVLFNLTQDQLAATRLPLGGLAKDEVREVARRAGLKVHAKPDSQDICFVPTGDYRDILREQIGDRLEPGPIVDETGREVGEHQGYQLYTVGQRRGIRIAFGSPRYVTRLDPSTNTVHIGPREEVLRKEFSVSQTNWIAMDTPREAVRCEVQIRYRHAPSPGTVFPEEGGLARVVFDQPEEAITPGQAAVFYDDDLVLGGGWID